MKAAIACIVLVPVFALSLAGCPHKEPSGGGATPESSGSPPASASEAAEEPEPAASASAPASAAPLTGCEARLAEFDKTLSEATFTCSKDNDCQCFAGGLSQNRGSECGGIVDAATGKKLATIEKAAKKQGCANSASCEPWTCAPVCEEGRCQKGEKKKKKK